MLRKRTGPWVASVVLAIAYVGRAGLCYRQLSWRSTQLGFQFIRLLASSVSCNFWQSQATLREIPRHGMFTLLVNSSPFSIRFVTRTDIMIFFFSVLAVKLHDCSGFWREWYKALVNLISLLCNKLCRTNTVRLGAAGMVVSGIGFAIQIWVIQRGGPVFVSGYLPLQTMLVAVMASIALSEEFYLGGWVSLSRQLINFFSSL